MLPYIMQRLHAWQQGLTLHCCQPARCSFPPPQTHEDYPWGICPWLPTDAYGGGGGCDGRWSCFRSRTITRSCRRAGACCMQ